MAPQKNFAWWEENPSRGISADSLKQKDFTLQKVSKNGEWMATQLA
jgi:hypothetical protein